MLLTVKKTKTPVNCFFLVCYIVLIIYLLCPLLIYRAKTHRILLCFIFFNFRAHFGYYSMYTCKMDEFKANEYLYDFPPNILQFSQKP